MVSMYQPWYVYNLATILAKMLLPHKIKTVLALVVIIVLLLGICFRQISGRNRQLASGCYVETLTRFGSNLKFDQQSCPTDSIMTNSTLTNSPPLHDVCPTLFIVGARKGGSTSLLKYISQHPEFKGALLDRGLHSGETMFFRKKFKNLAWEEYMSWFPTESGRRLMTGESSVAYLVDCLVPRRIFEYCGRQAKIVMLLRNPVDRFVSNFQMRVRARKIGKDRHLAEFIQHEVDVFLHDTNREGSADTKQDLYHGWSSFWCKFPSTGNIIYEGIYYIHLMNWLCNFPAENITIINSEEFLQNTHKIVKQVFQFLGLRPLPDDETYKMPLAKVYNHFWVILMIFHLISS